MFRQILVHPDDQDLQRILWNSGEPGSPIDFRLQTVTYGTACAPFLAIRTLRELAALERDNLPLGAASLDDDSYVDDILSGTDTLPDALRRRDELIELLAKGKFELGKWAANHRSLLPLGTSEAAASSTQPVLSGQPAKMLGVMWSPACDEFLFEFTPPDPGGRPITKRVVLSWISRIFDPLDWIGPIVVRAKIFLQDLWLSHTGWDEPISRPMLRCWREFVNALETLPVLRIPRWTSLSTDTKGIELHVFCDTSTRAYAAALYVRFPISNDCYRTTLLTSKSKVSPLHTVTVPRLELCAAQLGARLLCHVLKENRFSKCPITAWSDSQVALAWIHGHPSRWKTFVANRVSYIQTSLPALTWRYVPSSDNPADVASRGTEPELLRDSPLWWHGPPWLSQSEQCWPKKVLQDVTSPGEEAPRSLLSNVARVDEEPWTLLSRSEPNSGSSRNHAC
jgi:hypothetical protein